MESIIVCNTAGDTLSKINLSDYSVKNISLDLGEKPVGPHGLAVNGTQIITANSYSNSISIVDFYKEKEVSNIYVGAHPNDVKVFDKKAFVVCGESDSLIVVDLLNEKIIMEIQLGLFPHSIEIDKDKGIAYVSNMESHSLTVVDCVNYKVIKNIITPEYPTKILLSKDKNNIYLCESYLGKGIEGYVSIISPEDYKEKKRIKVGECPVDIYEYDDVLYVSNLNEGYISVVDIEKGREIKKIFVGGMPRGIIKYKDDIFVGNNMKGKVNIINLKKRIIKTITVGKEPNAMIIVDFQKITN